MLPKASFCSRLAPGQDTNHAWPGSLIESGLSPFVHIAPAVQRRALFLKRGRFIHIPHQLLETGRETATLVLCEKLAHFADATARLEDESAGM